MIIKTGHIYFIDFTAQDDEFTYNGRAEVISLPAQNEFGMYGVRFMDIVPMEPEDGLAFLNGSSFVAEVIDFSKI